MKYRPSDTLSQFSYDSAQSADSKDVYVTASDIRRRLSESVQRNTGKRNFKVNIKASYERAAGKMKSYPNM